MKRLLPLAALALIAGAATACSDETEPAPAVTSSSSSTTAAAPVTTTTAETTSAPSTTEPAPTTTTTTTAAVQPTDIGELDLDLEGDPCNGVTSVDFDGTHYECIGGVFRAQ